MDQEDCIILGTSLLKMKARCIRQKLRMCVKCQIEVRGVKKGKEFKVHSAQGGNEKNKCDSCLK